MRVGSYRLLSDRIRQDDQEPPTRSKWSNQYWLSTDEFYCSIRDRLGIYGMDDNDKVPLSYCYASYSSYFDN